MAYSHPHLTTGDENFHDLCGGRGKSGGLRIPTDGASNTLPHTLLIAGFAGAGKSTLAAQLLAKSLARNNFEQSCSNFDEDVWPANAQGIYYTLDQPGREIRRMLMDFFGMRNESIALFEVSEFKDPLDVLYSKAQDNKKSLMRNATIFVREVPYDASYQAIRECIKDDTRSGPAEQRIKIVVIDSMNSVGRAQEGDEVQRNFKRILDSAKDSNNQQCYSTIITYEMDERSRLAEEYLADAVILLSSERQLATRRVMEIRKARLQEHFIGPHEFRIESTGIKVYPSIVVRSRMSEQKLKDKSPAGAMIKIGVQSIDTLLESRSAWNMHAGSTTLIWGDPGTGKTELSIRFLVEEWRKSPKSSVIFLTTKIDARIIMNNISERVAQDKEVQSSLQVGSMLEAAHIVDKLVGIIDAGDPHKSHARIFSDIVDEVEKKRNQGVEVKRAVVYGLGLVEETPEFRDLQWRFLSVLVLYLRSEKISTVLIDWPLERHRDQSDTARPRASKLCGNEIKTFVDPVNGRSLTVSRSDYASVEEEFRWDVDKETWNRDH